MKNAFSIRDKAILVGLYLSKFDEDALITLGFKTFNEAFNTLGYSIGAKPASIKNYRDEFDPLFPNKRKGWHNRAIREYCKRFYNDFSSLGFQVFTDLIKSFLFTDYEVEKIIEKVEQKDRTESIARRLITGRAAEEYFKINYSLVHNFEGFEIKDTTMLACGFDFQLFFKNDFYCVEVKGLSSSSGNISLTEKEFRTAKELKEQYCLFVALNFIEKPFHQTFFNPLNSVLSFKKAEREIVQINYTASI